MTAIRPGLTLRPLASSPLVVLLPASHPLASQAEADLRDLAGALFIDSPAGYGNRTVVDERRAAGRRDEGVGAARSPSCARTAPNGCQRSRLYSRASAWPWSPISPR
ncbi:LysR substrate-binding domain-containing protein [Actinacidiphila glaucinigra]|uniref:LysR substrate-binding domain-containing protein n=1 Tax=Actinacidiphila glaucinigra TaxID=235986 RepID=UPI00370DA651